MPPALGELLEKGAAYETLVTKQQRLAEQAPGAGREAAKRDPAGCQARFEKKYPGFRAETDLIRLADAMQRQLDGLIAQQKETKPGSQEHDRLSVLIEKLPREIEHFRTEAAKPRLRP